MGTNYYAELNFCPNCERFDKIHLGKSSAGWKFAIEIHELYYKSFEEFADFIQKEEVKIYDEYGEEFTANELLDIIFLKQKGRSHFEDYPKSKYKNCEEADLNNGAFS